MNRKIRIFIPNKKGNPSSLKKWKDFNRGTGSRGLSVFRQFLISSQIMTFLLTEGFSSSKHQLSKSFAQGLNQAPKVN